MIMKYCDKDASLKEKTVVITLLHTGLRASELANLAVSDIVQIQGKWKLHVREGKGLRIGSSPSPQSVWKHYKPGRKRAGK